MRKKEKNWIDKSNLTNARLFRVSDSKQKTERKHRDNFSLKKVLSAECIIVVNDIWVLLYVVSFANKFKLNRSKHDKVLISIFFLSLLCFVFFHHCYWGSQIQYISVHWLHILSANPLQLHSNNNCIIAKSKHDNQTKQKQSTVNSHKKGRIAQSYICIVIEQRFSSLEISHCCTWNVYFTINTCYL